MVPEDIISITGQQVELGSKEMTAPVNSMEFLPQELKKQWIDLKQEKDVMFLDAWEVNETEKESKVHVQQFYGTIYDVNVNNLSNNSESGHFSSSRHF